MALLRSAFLTGLVAGLFAFLSVPALAQVPSAGQDHLVEAQVHRFSGPPERPRRHLRVSDPASLSAAEAEAVYIELRDSLGQGYAAKGDPVGAVYLDWTRYNRAPFASATHGRRYANVYANDIARAYGRSVVNRPLPVGSIVAKDSFVVTRDGEIAPGPLFVMEKMPQGFNYVTGDWRYAMITPAGVLAGQTLGEGAERVEFCISCHLAREAQDHLFFVPQDFRLLP